MSGKQKALLILVAVALVVLLVIAVGANSGKKRGDPTQSNGFVNWLHKLGAGSSAVDPSTVTANCEAVQGQPHTYKVINTCTLTVADPGSLRSLLLSSDAKFGVDSPAPSDAGFNVKAEVEPTPSPGGVPKARASVPVDKKTLVVLTCPAPAPLCVVTVEAE